MKKIEDTKGKHVVMGDGYFLATHGCRTTSILRAQTLSLRDAKLAAYDCEKIFELTSLSYELEEVKR